MTEEKIVVVREAHSAQDDLVYIGPQGNVCHYLVVGLVGICEEGDLLARDQGVVKVDTGDTGGNEFAGLTALVRVYRRTAGLALLAFNLGAAVYWVAVCVEEAAGQLVADLKGRRRAEEGHFRIGGNALGAGEHLQGDPVSAGFHHLGEPAAHGCEFIVGHALGIQGYGCLGYGLQACVRTLECFS